MRPSHAETSEDHGTLCWLSHSTCLTLPPWVGSDPLLLALPHFASHFFPALAKNSDWVDQFRVKFLGSVQVPYHKGNDVLCAAMQKVPGPITDIVYWGNGHKGLEAVKALCPARG